MLKMYVSLFALMGVMGSLSEPAWCMEEEVAVAESSGKRRHEKNGELEHQRKKKGAKKNQPKLEPTLRGCPSEIHQHIYSFLFSGTLPEVVKNFASLELTSPLFLPETMYAIQQRTLSLKKSIRNSNLEEWEQNSHLRDFVQAHFIMDTIKQAQGLDILGRERVYLNALQEESFVAESRLLAYQLALSWNSHYQRDEDIKRNTNTNIHYGRSYEFDAISQKLAKEKTTATFHSFLRDLKKDKAQHRPFDSEKYKALLEIYYFLRKDPQAIPMFNYSDPVGDELKEIAKQEDLGALSKIPPAQLNLLGSFNNFYLDMRFSKNSVFLQGKMFLGSAIQGDPVGQFSLSCLYLSDHNNIMSFLLEENDACDDNAFNYLVARRENKTQPNRIENCDVPLTNDPECQLAGAYWTGEAAEKGLPEAQNNLAILQLQGIGVSQDKAQAFRGFTEAAGKGLAFARYNLGVCYADGIGTDQNDGLALKWFKKAAKRGMTRAQFNVGYYYQVGKGCDQSDSEAVKWYQKAVNNEDPFSYNSTINQELDSAAENNLGILYELGRGVEQDLSKAYELYSSAWGQENEEPCLNLRRCYKNGIGVSEGKNKEEEIEELNESAASLFTKEGEFFAMDDTVPVQMKPKNWFFMVYPEYK